MIAFAGFFQHHEVLLQVFLFGESNPIDALQLLARLITLPISTRYVGQFYSLDESGVRNMWPAAKVHEVALRIKRKGFVGAAFFNQFNFVLVAFLLEKLQGFIPSNVSADVAIFLPGQFEHFFLNLGQVVQ